MAKLKAGGRRGSLAGWAVSESNGSGRSSWQLLRTVTTACPINNPDRVTTRGSGGGLGRRKESVVGLVQQPTNKNGGDSTSFLITTFRNSDVAAD